MLLRLIHGVKCIDVSFLFNAAYYSITWIYHILFIHPPVDRHLACFQISAIINDDAMNIQEHVFMRIYTSSFLELNPRRRMAGLCEGTLTAAIPWAPPDSGVQRQWKSTKQL